MRGLDRWRSQTLLPALVVGALAAVVAAGVSAQTSIPEWGVPTANSQPTNLQVDKSGNVWFTEFGANTIGRISQSGVIQEYSISTPSSQPWGIAVDSTGRIWFTEAAGNKIGNIAPGGGSMGQDNIPTSDAQPRGIAVDNNGNAWFAEFNRNKIGKLSGSTFTEYDIPTSNSQPWGVAIDSSGNVWFTERNANKIGRMTTSGAFSEFGIPTSGSGPTGIAIDSAGNVWFAEYDGNKIGMMTQTGVFTEYNLPTAYSKPAWLSIDAAGGVWYVGSGSNSFGRVLGGAVADYGVPTANSTPMGIAVDGNGNVWIAEQSANKIAKAMGFVTAGTPTPTLATTTATAQPSATPLPAATAVPIATPLPAPHDNRYFTPTGYRIDNDTFWDYFNKRGGVFTFGYPVSRTFTFLGFTTQFFQREILQIGPDGSARTMNMLDPGLMPYTRINGSTFPAPDAALAAVAPQPGSPDYDLKVQDFITNFAPDQFEGMSVNFHQAFVNTVKLDDAFPQGGGNPALLPLLNLEIWGVTTSRPQRDPSNGNFVYLRFQRGIMHYDASNGATQALLLADYLKAIITGANLPADLDQQAVGSVFYRQYNPAKTGWVDRPDVLVATDLSFAFERQ